MNTNHFAFPYLDKAVQLNDTLLGLPMGVLSIVGCIGVACFLFALTFVKNKYVPGMTIGSGLVLNVVGTPPTTWANFVRSLILGLIAGVVAWIWFKKFGQKWIDPKIFQQNGTDTEQLEKTKVEKLPP